MPKCGLKISINGQIRDPVSLSGHQQKKHQKRVLFAANPSYKNILQLSKKNKGLNFHHFLTFSKNITLDLQVASYSPLSYA